MSQFLYVHDCSATPITTSSYVELEASTTDNASAIQFFYFATDTSLGLVSLGVGSSGFEIDSAVCSQKVGTPISIFIAEGTRLAVKAIGSSVSTGYIILCLLP